jgi:dsRNA-specific ribonuclease
LRLDDLQSKSVAVSRAAFESKEGQELWISKCESSHTLPKFLGDVMEMLFASIYLDSNNSLFQTKACIERILDYPISIFKMNELSLEHPLGMLQQIFRFCKKFQILTKEICTKEVRFSCSIQIHDVVLAVETGSSIQLAKRNAARCALLNVQGNSLCTLCCCKANI